jgi:hypothetical protein
MFRSENRARIFVLGTLAMCGIAVMAAVALVTIRAVFLSPRPPGTLEPWVATGLADMETYSAQQTAAAPLPAANVTPGMVQPTPEVGPTPAPQAGGATGSPMGHIVFTCFIEHHDDICLINADGSGYTRLTTDPATDWYAALSPDSQIISFSSKRTGNWELFLLDIPTQNVQQMTENFGQIYAPEISPDGTRVVFVTTLNGKQDLYVMDVSGMNAFRLTDDPADDFDPTWSPDGTRIAFTSNRTGTSELHMVTPGGTRCCRLRQGR